MAPAAARRAKAVQRTHSQGLRGNPDACRPGRGSAFYIRANRAGGNARPVSALSVQPTAAMGPGSRAAALVVFPPLLTSKAVPRPGRPVPRGHPGRRMARRGRRAPRVGGYAGKRATTGRPYNVGPSYGSFAGPPSPHATRGTAAGLARGPHGTGQAVSYPRGRRVRDTAPYRFLSTPDSSLKALISSSSWSAWRCTSSHTVPYHRSLSSWAVRPCCSTQV